MTLQAAAAMIAANPGLLMWCPCCGQRMPLFMTGDYPNTVILDDRPPFELTYNCPHCFARLHEKAGRLPKAK